MLVRVTYDPASAHTVVKTVAVAVQIPDSLRVQKPVDLIIRTLTKKQEGCDIQSDIDSDTLALYMSALARAAVWDRASETKAAIETDERLLT